MCGSSVLIFRFRFHRSGTEDSGDLFWFCLSLQLELSCPTSIRSKVFLDNFKFLDFQEVWGNSPTADTQLPIVSGHWYHRLQITRLLWSIKSLFELSYQCKEESQRTVLSVSASNAFARMPDHRSLWQGVIWVLLPFPNVCANWPQGFLCGDSDDLDHFCGDFG
ncbi:hypothetical protein CEXT_757791 [Caerostris extrusa]|uniref:Uncharacterized protein n=1 Tax=Caerostris extrusa TaxID=172846 RepID=A0AAV4P7N6_CAEEX|nr:hypothetical protein CEXT_757791 [Caerostris extrusa]